MLTLGLNCPMKVADGSVVKTGDSGQFMILRSWI